jgi:hypothetical protein
MNVGLHRQRRWVCASFVTRGIVGINETSDIQSERVSHASGYAIVIAKRAGASPLEFFRFQELLAVCVRARILPKSVELTV